MARTLINSIDAPIAARYSSTVGLSMNSGTTYYLDFPTKAVDTNNAVLGAGGGSTTVVGTGWRFVTPATGAGIYLIIPVVTFSTSVVQDCNVVVYKNNVAISFNSSPSLSWTGALDNSRGAGDIVKLSSGDVIQVGVRQTAGSARSLSTTLDSVRVSIIKVGSNI
jgi:hypothetical protein